MRRQVWASNRERPIQQAAQRQKCDAQLCVESRPHFLISPQALATCWTQKTSLHLLGNNISPYVRVWKVSLHQTPVEKRISLKDDVHDAFLLIYIC